MVWKITSEVLNIKECFQYLLTEVMGYPERATCVITEFVTDQTLTTLHILPLASDHYASVTDKSVISW